MPITARTALALKLTRTYGTWIELRDDRSGSVSRVRAVPSPVDGKIQIEIDAPVHVHVDRVGSAAQSAAAPHKAVPGA